jgi:hypothetical protein
MTIGTCLIGCLPGLVVCPVRKVCLRQTCDWLFRSQTWASKVPIKRTSCVNQQAMALHNWKSRDFNRFLAHRHIPGTNQEDENASIFIARAADAVISCQHFLTRCAY